MRILAAILRRLVAIRDFWHFQIQTFTYVNLYNAPPNDSQRNTQQHNPTANTTQNNTHNHKSALTARHGVIQDYGTQDSEIHANQTPQLNAQNLAHRLHSTPPDSLNYNATDSPNSNPTSPYLATLQTYSKQRFTTLAQLFCTTPKPHAIARLLYHKESMRTYFCVLPIDCLVGAQITIERAQLQREQTLDSVILSQAQTYSLIPYYHEYRYFLQQLGDTLSFQVFCVEEALLQQYAAQYSGTLLCLNPLEMCCALGALFPTLKCYTIIFQDTHKHALCHYRDGALIVSIVLERKEALQNYYHLIDDFGRILYCDLSGDAALLRDFEDITTLFGAPLAECFHILALYHIRTKPIFTHFYAQKFYAIRSKIKMLFGATCVFFAFYCGHFFYNSYQYHQFVQQQEQHYQSQIESLYHKKQHYPSMYERIYEQLLENKSLNFCLRQDYNEINEWESYPCPPR